MKALLIIDCISTFEFDDWRPTLAVAKRIAPRIAGLKARAHDTGVPVVYVNDMEGRWQSDRTEFVARCAANDARGHRVVRLLEPVADDYFVFKPKHSGFYATPLAELLVGLHATELVLTGLSSHQCVLFTAVDAFVRDYRVIVPPDCIGAPAATQTRHALFVLRDALQARTPTSRRLAFD